MEEWHKIITNFLRTIPYAEKDYQERIVSFLISIGLGWQDEDIMQQLSINIGSMQRAIPDIVLFVDGKPEVVIEVKSPHHVKQDKDILQLMSYMKQLEINVGIYFGEKVEVYYKELGRGCPEIKLFDVSLSTDDPDWELFVEMFNREVFCLEKVKAFYEDRIAALHDEEIVNQQLERFTSSTGPEIVKCAISDYLRKEGVKPGIIDLISSKIRISIERMDEKPDIPRHQEVMAIPVVASKESKKPNAYFTIDGNGAYGVKDLALKIISIVNERDSNLKFDDLNQMFKLGKRAFIKPLKEIQEWRKNNITDMSKGTRWLENNVLISGDGIEFVVRNAWTQDNITPVIKVGKDYGLDIKRIQ